MKTVKIIIVALLAIALGSNSYAQMQDHSKMVSTKTETLKVSGNCDLCKARIEKAAKSVSGVMTAEWTAEKQMIHVEFDPAKTSSDAIQKAIAKVGHDTEKFKASDMTYKQLPECCWYRK